MSPESLAHQACEIEIERLNQPIGKQDQYIAAYGGLRRIQFNRDESVHTQAIPVASETVARLEENFTLFYTGIQRPRRDHLCTNRNVLRAPKRYCK